MKATDVLVEEHRVIEGVLNSLENAIKRLESGRQVRPEFFLSATEFIRGYADGSHHQKEEGVLFKYMMVQGLTDQGCPLGVMLAEHEAARQYTMALYSAAEAVKAGDEGAVRRIIMSARSYIALLHQHIYKEDHILFPMADGLIPAESQGPVWEDFNNVLHEENAEGVHERYTALAESLAKEIQYA